MQNFYPSLLRNWIFPLAQKFQGRDYLSTLQDSRQIQTLDPEDIRGIQLHKLKNILRHAYKTVPYYKDSFNKVGLNPEDIRNLEDLELIPIITKTEIQDAPDLFISTNPPSRAQIFRTSGTSGTPLTFHLDQASITAGLVSRFRTLEWWGIQLGDRYLKIREEYIDPLVIPSLRTKIKIRFIDPLENMVMNRRLVSPFDMSQRKLNQYWRLMKDFNPKYLFGYPSAAQHLAKFIQNSGYKANKLKLKLVVSMGEILLKSHQDSFRQVFNCPTADEYGAAEVGVIAYSFPCGEIHNMDDFQIVEVEKSDPQDKYGEIILTSLENYVNPLIRYKIGDLAVPSQHQSGCPLKIGFSRLGKIIGREFDILHLPRGITTHSMIIDSVMWKLDGVRKYQVVQQPSGSFVFTLVLDSPDKQPYLEREIKSRMYRRLGIRDIKVVQVTSIPPDPSGKFRYVKIQK